jgi:ABC-2 type transport system ATP-binding protein
LGFLGPNGAGKSTTIRILSTLLKPTRGKVKINGFELLKNPDGVRKSIGLVAEKVILYDLLTLRENLEFFGALNQLSLKEIEKKIKFWVKKLKLEKWINHKVGTFSTGMKQRVNIIRALLTEPKVLFLDEPSLGLDPQTTRLIRDFIKDLKKEGTTIILTTHDMHEAELLSDRVAIMDHGRIVALDTPQNLKKLVKGVKNPTLEDVFLHLTGRDVRDKIHSLTLRARRF